ncbi:Elicitin [Phytophthora megakarya]|uniref:Elicitin n=1 Tax=Phytophthora megakarya TaxID=4795 RepID=A0A225WW85_9STRA|nr:Elicitin [Phytophthora megakarya]
MKSFIAFAAFVSTVSAASTSGSYADCSSTVLSALLTDQYIDQCATDSGYVFTAASIPDQDTIDKMCASSACQSLLADVTAMDLSECVIPVGDNILLLADLVDYVPAHCPASSTSSTTSSSTGSTTTATTAPTTSTTSSASSASTPTATPATTTSSSTSTTTTTTATAC